MTNKERERERIEAFLERKIVKLDFMLSLWQTDYNASLTMLKVS